MDTLSLKANKRERLGKALDKLRKEGFIPAELYGSGVDNVHLSVDQAEFLKVYKEGGENTIVNVSFDGDTRPVLIHDVQVDPISLDVLSIDFYQVDLTKKVTTHVPLEFVGTSHAVDELEGVLIKSLDEVEIEALPNNIPHSIEVDISVLDEFGKSITVADLKAGADFEITTDGEMTVASVSEPREEEEEVVEEMSVEDIEVEGEKKDDEEGGEGEADSEAPEGGEDVQEKPE